MDIILIMSLFWTTYGIFGVLGFQKISPRYRGHSWTKDYIRRQGISWLLLGIPWLVFNRAAIRFHADIAAGPQFLTLLALAIPSLLFSFAQEKKYGAMVKQEGREN